MAQFKVGDRVRIVGTVNNFLKPLVGREAVIVSTSCVSNHWVIDLPAPDGFPCHFATHHLAPLTDPDAERFVESLKKLAREPRVEKVSV